VANTPPDQWRKRHQTSGENATRTSSSSYEPLPPLPAGGSGERDDLPTGGLRLEGAPPGEIKKDAPKFGDIPPVDEKQFQEFWRQFPNHENEDDARRAYTAAIAKGVDHKTIMAGVLRYAECATNRRADFIAKPANWLRGERWKENPQPNVVNGHAPRRRRRSTEDICMSVADDYERRQQQ